MARSPETSNWVGLGEHEEQKQHRDEEEGEDQDAVNHCALVVQVHEDVSHQPCLESRDAKAYTHIDKSGTKVHVGHGYRNHGEHKQSRAYYRVGLNVLLEFFRGVCHKKVS